MKVFENQEPKRKKNEEEEEEEEEEEGDWEKRLRHINMLKEVESEVRIK